MAASSPTLAEYFDAASQASFDGSIGTNLTSLITSTEDKDGFSAEAFVTPEKQLIVAFAGTDFKALVSDPDPASGSSRELAEYQIAGDISIFDGFNPPAFADGTSFVQQAESAATAAGISIAPGNVFVAGHSLGGAIAAYVAAQDDLPGTTFAAPGLAPGDIPAGADGGAVTAYVEYGDPIGNYGTDPNTPSDPNVEGTFLRNPGITRFGTTEYIGANPTTKPLLLAAEKEELTTAASIYAKNSSAGLALFLADAVANHALANYETDLGIATPSGSTSDLGITVQQLLAIVEQTLANSTSAGLVVSLDSNVSFTDPTTAVLTGTASSPAGVRSVEITAQVDGVKTDLGAATLKADGTFSFTDPLGSQAQSDITATATDDDGNSASQTASFSLQNGMKTDLFGASEGQGGGPTGLPLSRSGDSHVVEVQASGQTYLSDAYDIFVNGGQGDTAFIFTPGFGIDVVSGFRVAGSDHDLLALPASDFPSLAAVFRDTGDVDGSAFITDPKTGDAIRLGGVTTAELKAHPHDIALFG